MIWLLSLLGVAGAGIGGAAALGFGPAMLLFAGRILKWLGSLNGWQLLAIGLAVALLVDHAALILAHRHTAKFEKQLTAANGALNVSRANETALRGAIAKQNAAVADLAAKSAEQQKQAQDALRAAAGRVSDAQAVAQRLRGSAAQRPPGAACEPSATLKGQWQ